MAEILTIRTARAGDIAAIDLLLARSYPKLLKHDYPPSALVTAVPLISRAQPHLVTCGTYFVAEGEGGAILAAGGWTARGPGGAGAIRNWASIRHVVTDHRHTRRGVGRRLMAHVIETAGHAGHRGLHCLSTRTAVPFYRAVGFVPVGAREVTLGPGIVFPSVEMVRDL